MAYNLLKPVQIFTAQSMGVTLTSGAVEVRNQDNIGIQLHWTGTPTGTFAVQVSANHNEDINGNILTAGNWVSIPLLPAIAAAGAADDAYIDLNQLSAAYIRIVYTRTGGAGSLDAFVTAKGV